MATFTDDFNRADGALGGNWVAGISTQSISGGWAVSSVSALSANTSVSDGSRLLVTAYASASSSGTVGSGPAVKCASGSYQCYYAFVHYASSAWHLKINKRLVASNTTLQDVTLSGTPPPYNKISLEWNLGHLTATLNDSTTAEADDSDYAAYAYGGLWTYSASTPVNEVVIVGGSNPELSVSPAVIGNYGLATQLTFTGDRKSVV